MSQWASYIWKKALPTLFAGSIIAIINLFMDNADHKKDLAAHTWRLEQLEGRSSRSEARLDRNEEAIADVNNAQSEFHPEVIARLGELLDIANRKRK